MLFAADLRYWQAHNGVPEFRGKKLRVKSSSRERAYLDVQAIPIRRRLDRFIFEGEEVGDGGNTGFMALNWIVKRSPPAVILVGFDMRLDRGRHWHRDHGGGLSNPAVANVTRWRNVLQRQAAELARRGIAVYRESDASALTAFPVLSLRAALERYPCESFKSRNIRKTRPSPSKKRAPIAGRTRTRTTGESATP